MLPWMIGSILVVGLLAWKVIHAAELEDKNRKKVTSRY